MKKMIFVVCAITLSLAMIGCGSQPASMTKLSGVPDFVTQAYKNASEDVLVGIGTYKIGNDRSLISQARTLAATRARTDISRQLNSVIKNMVQDTTATSEVDSKATASFSVSVTQALSEAKLKGTKIKQEDLHDGVWWVVMEYSRSSMKAAMQETYDAYDAAQRLAIPAAVNNAFQEKMEAAFQKEKEEQMAKGPNTKIE